MKETFTVLNNVAKLSSEKLNGELLFDERQQMNFVKSQIYSLVVIATLSEKLERLNT